MPKLIINSKSIKATLLTILMSVIYWSAGAQPISISMPNTTVRKAMEYLQREYNYSISVRSDEIDIEKAVSIDLKQATINDAIKKIFEGQNVDFTVSDKKVSVFPAKAQTPAVRRKVKIKVLDENDQPLTGSVIMENGTENAVLTDGEGVGEITLSTANPSVRISFFGYIEQSLAIGSAANYSVKMSPQALALDDVVVVGYGTMTRRDITSAIGSFKPKAAERREVLSPDQMLQGRIAGVNISTASGVPGSSSRVSIRGIGSLNAGNEPLYVVDGVPLTSNAGDTGAWSQGESMTGLSTVNPSDIESIEVLKDAASAAIYGSRATNGVIIITTKSGRKGDSKIEIDATTSWGKMPRTGKLALADGDLLIEVFNEGIDNYNRQYGENIERYISPMPGKPAHDWLGDVLRIAKSHNVSAAISGGTDKINYYVSGTAKHIEGTAIDNDLNQYSMKSTLSGKVRPWLSFGTNTLLSYTDNERVASGYSGLNVVKAAVEQYPWDEPFLPNGEWATSSNVLVNNNPLQAIKESDVWVKTFRAITSAYLQFHLFEGLNFKTNFGGDIQSLEEHIYYSSKHQSAKPTVDNPMGGRLIDSRKDRISIIWDNTLSYDKKMDFGLNVGTVLGHSLQIDDSSSAIQSGWGFPSSSFDVNSVATSFTDVSTSRSQYGLQSFFGRLNLNYRNRYVGTFTLRADGSSKFAPENRWGYFPSASLGWNVNDESWWKPKDISLKIRASVGATGNQGGIGAYAYQQLASGGLNYGGKSGLGLSATGNRDLKWEKAVQENFGVDMSFWKGALSFTVDVFNKDTYDLIYNRPTMITTGYTTMITNIGAMNNKGLELSLAANAGKRDFRWHSDFNISFIRNKLTKLLDDEDIIKTDNFHALKVGHEVGSFYMVKMNGIYQYDEDVPKYLYDNEGVRAGDVIFDDYNKDGKITDDDRQFVGSANPKFSGGFNNTFTYKNLELSVFTTFSYGNKIYEYWTGGLRLGTGQWPQLKSVCEQRWTGPGTTDTTPRAMYNHTWNSTKFINTRFLHDASYLRLRSLTLSYKLPQKYLSKANIDNVRMFVQCDNLFVITNWPYLDPEVTVTNNATQMGYDWLNPGQPRTITIGMNLKF